MNQNHATVVINDPNRFFAEGLMNCLHDEYSAIGLQIKFTDHIFNHHSRLLFLAGDVLSAIHAQYLNHHMTTRKLQVFTIYNSPAERARNALSYNKLSHYIPLYRTQSINEISTIIRCRIHSASDRDMLKNSCTKRADPPFTQRETEVLRYLARGISNGAVARFLKISEKTVSAHKRNIMSKLNMIRPAELHYWLLQEGWCESWRSHKNDTLNQ